MNKSEKNNYEKLFVKSQQKAELLIANSDFQNEIVKLRNRWNIPKDGFRTNKESMEWEHRLIRESDEYIKSKEFQQALNKIRDKKKLTEKKQALRKLNLAIPLNAFRQDLISLERKFKLESDWENFLRGYVLTNRINPSGRPIITTKLNIETGERELYIQIFGNTTLKDIERIWPEVKIIQKNLFQAKGRFKKMKKLKRNKRILELTQQGFSGEEIRKKIKEEFGESLLSHEVAKIKYQFKKEVRL